VKSPFVNSNSIPSTRSTPELRPPLSPNGKPDAVDLIGRVAIIRRDLDRHIGAFEPPLERRVVVIRILYLRRRARASCIRTARTPERGRRRDCCRRRCTAPGTSPALARTARPRSAAPCRDRAYRSAQARRKRVVGASRRIGIAQQQVAVLPSGWTVCTGCAGIELSTGQLKPTKGIAGRPLAGGVGMTYGASVMGL
jgi:hypothetical protein